MPLRNLFLENPNIIINSDIDGMLCGMVLQKYFDCKIVGFSNSKEYVWVVPEIADIDKPVYIDLFVNRPHVVCIEQHVISYNEEHHQRLINYGTKFNPNLERNRTFLGDMGVEYKFKYPFATFHYILNLMEREGIRVELPNLFEAKQFHAYNAPERIVETNAGQLILRADDALYSTLHAFVPNANEWWRWLNPNEAFESISMLTDFIQTCDPTNARQYKLDIGHFFQEIGCIEEEDPFQNDGSFRYISSEEGEILPEVLYYRDVVCEIMGMPLDLPLHYVIHQGTYDKFKCVRIRDINRLFSQRLYSYAFIYGPRIPIDKPNRKNFSYTLDMV
jgi:hypothetical protein